MADALIVATGAQSLMLDLPAEHRLLGHGLSTCATCDGFFFKGHEIAVVGGGDSALEEAIFLTKFAEKVTVVVRRDELQASKIMQERAFKNERTGAFSGAMSSRIRGEARLEGIEVENVQTGARAVLPVTGLFVAIGHRPNTDLFTDPSTWTRPATSTAQPGRTITNVEGVFASDVAQDRI